MITKIGDIWFQNRLLSNEKSPLTHLVFGKGTNKPSKENEQLEDYLFEKKPRFQIDLDNNQIKCTANLTVLELEQVREIGVMANDVLVSRDLFQPEIITPVVSDIEIEYILSFSNEIINKEWYQHEEPEFNKVYYSVVSNVIKGVCENNTNTGYLAVGRISEVQERPASYFYNVKNNKLYIHTSKSNSPENYNLSLKYIEV